MKKLICIVCIIYTITFSLTGVTEEYIQRKKSFFGSFDTIITLLAYTTSQADFDEHLKLVEEKFLQYHKSFDKYNSYESNVNLHDLNLRGHIEPLRVDDELFDLLVFCKSHESLLDGYINVAMGGVLDIWHDYRENGSFDPNVASLPPMEALFAAAEHTDFNNVIMNDDDRTVFIADPELKIDVGAVAKGYATQKIGEWLLTTDMKSFLISAGGNVFVGNSPLDGRDDWSIGIQNPDAFILDDSTSGYIDTIYAHNTSVVTSGDYQRYYVVDGKRYNHVISPQTLMPADSYRSVTVVCNDSGLADILSTALFIMPIEEGVRLVEESENVEALWILADSGEVVLSDGMKLMSKNFGFQ